MENNRRLLIISCSQRKRTDLALLPAIERYNGPAFAVVRRYLRTQSPPDLDIYILSAFYGLIPHHHPILEYEQKMTLAQSENMQPKLLGELAQITKTFTYSEFCLSMGQVYLNSLKDFEAILPNKAKVTVAGGGTGKRLSQLRQWLYHDKSLLTNEPTRAHGRACIGGVEVAMTPEEVFKQARQALIDRPGKALCYTTWYVLIDGQRIAPKWLVSQLTGLPVSKFHTDTARHALVLQL